MATDGIVLVHGGLHTSACWELVLPHLETPACAVDLPGRGTRPADLATVTLGDCVAAVIDAADAAGFGRFALAGHSLGGVTVTETAFRHADRVSHLVYVAAIIPGVGANAASFFTDQDVREMPKPDEARARPFFCNDLTDEQWVHHRAQLVPDAPGIMNGRISGHASGIPATYVNMTHDVPIPPDLADRMVANLGPGVVRHTLDGGHTVMVARPRVLAAIIDDAVAR